MVFNVATDQPVAVGVRQNKECTVMPVQMPVQMGLFSVPPKNL